MVLQSDIVDRHRRSNSSIPRCTIVKSDVRACALQDENSMHSAGFFRVVRGLLSPTRPEDHRIRETTVTMHVDPRQSLAHAALSVDGLCVVRGQRPVLHDVSLCFGPGTMPGRPLLHRRRAAYYWKQTFQGVAEARLSPGQEQATGQRRASTASAAASTDLASRIELDGQMMRVRKVSGGISNQNCQWTRPAKACTGPRSAL